MGTTTCTRFEIMDRLAVVMTLYRPPSTLYRFEYCRQPAGDGVRRYRSFRHRTGEQFGGIYCLRGADRGNTVGRATV